MSRISHLAFALAAALVSIQAQAVQRTFVISTGNDANAAANCTFTNPCRSFQAAHGVTDPNGEIVALDAAGYGVITITKSISIIGNPGFYAGISASTGNAVTIATAGVNVTLRGLNINGVGAFTGINLTNGASLTIENCEISGFTNKGITAQLTSGSVYVRVMNTTVRNNGTDGIFLGSGVIGDVSGSKVMGNGNVGVFAQETTGGLASVVTVTDTVSASNTWGVAASGTPANVKLTVGASTISNSTAAGVENEGGTISIGGSTVSGNQLTGLRNVSGTLETQGNNLIRNNMPANTQGTITAVGGS